MVVRPVYTDCSNPTASSCYLAHQDKSGEKIRTSLGTCRKRDQRSKPDDAVQSFVVYGCSEAIDKSGSDATICFPAGSAQMSELTWQAVPRLTALLDNGASFIAVDCSVWEHLGSPLLIDDHITIENADSGLRKSKGLLPRICLGISGFSVLVQAQVVENAPFELLLGRPFFIHCKAVLRDHDADSNEIELTHPTTLDRVVLPTAPRHYRKHTQCPAAGFHKAQ